MKWIRVRNAVSKVTKKNNILPELSIVLGLESEDFDGSADNGIVSKDGSIAALSKVGAGC